MDSSEGHGIAATRRARWIDELPADFAHAFDLVGPPRDPDEPPEIADANPLARLLAPEALEAWAREVRERSELIGFWIAWHQAGGFKGLVLSGWNRATVYRRLKRFRVVFDAHPDEYQFDWIKLDLPKVWVDELLPPANGPVSSETA